MSLPAGRQDADAPITLLVKDIVADLGTLVQKQLELARIEMRDELDAAKAGMGAMLFGGLVLGAALTLGVVAAAQAIGLQLGWAAWLATAVAGGALAAIGAVLFGFAVFRLRARSLYPKRAARGLQEDLQWLTKSPS